MLLYDADGLKIRAHLQAGLNGVAEQNLFWNFADSFAPSSDYNPRKQWLEGYIKPGISFNNDLNERLHLYGKASAVASGTLGIDAYDTGNTGRITLEEAYLGVRTEMSAGTSLDFSYGPREYKVGTGMLIANGGNSGFERGALKFGPRKAWKSAAIAKLSYDGFNATGFYLQPNELPDSSSNTQFLGTELRYNWGTESFAGITYGHVVKSNSAYPKAAPDGIGAPSILPDAREGLNFINAYAIGKPLPNIIENLIAGGEYAYEWNDQINLSAWAGRVYIGYNFTDAVWSPELAVAYQTFSGDDPHTSRLERFDPLFYEGNPSSWSTGSKSSMVFINSNVSAYLVSLRVKPTERDALTLRYAHIRANELLSPIQFGQGTRVETNDGVPNPIAGVTSHHLSDDVFLEYNRVLNSHTYLTVGFSVSFPGSGIDSMINGKAPIWTGGFANVVVNF
ncbi:alginate export family protein [Pseudochrobactrum sp. sp1633]|uniref:alginate export family protein n=1 Tax=Pseudochrobactrum sp. sp1633 TaxID=3036706 RepID=UPI0025A6599B|nr:alginate export family protein [Pseudochrobactrum sp. sp1633]MDM8344204.1 alginate export family protein [Pseudochrobactrum sp. sp1633]HWD14663.1 alginate export family protein [Pseudochrobactrum sp.]